MKNYQKIAVLENEVQAQLLDSVLTERGIPHLMRSYHDIAYDGLFQYRQGWGHVEAPDECKKEILEILDELPQHPLSPDSDTTTAEPEETTL